MKHVTLSVLLNGGMWIYNKSFPRSVNLNSVLVILCQIEVLIDFPCLMSKMSESVDYEYQLSDKIGGDGEFF